MLSATISASAFPATDDGPGDATTLGVRNSMAGSKEPARSAKEKQVRAKRKASERHQRADVLGSPRCLPSSITPQMIHLEMSLQAVAVAHARGQTRVPQRQPNRAWKRKRSQQGKTGDKQDGSKKKRAQQMAHNFKLASCTHRIPTPISKMRRKASEMRSACEAASRVERAARGFDG